MIQYIKSILSFLYNWICRPRRTLFEYVCNNPWKIHSDKLVLKARFDRTFGYALNLKHPNTFNEKIQWLKLYDRNPAYTLLADKLEVKAIVSNLIGSKYVIPLIKSYSSVDEIDLSELPDRFVLKCNHDSESVIICKDKNTFDLDAARLKLTKCLAADYYKLGREWPYKNITKRIIAEQYMENLGDSSLSDYKFFCFNGEPKFLYISYGLEDHRTAKISYITMNWERAPFHRPDFAEFEELPQKPKSFDDMVEKARILSAGIPLVRVDFYEINGNAMFGEMTFHPAGGWARFQPAEWDEIIGGMLTLPSKKR